MSSTKGLYDDPRYLTWVKRAFETRYPHAATLLTRPDDPDHLNAACLWRGFKEGVEFAYLEELEQLHRARKIGEKSCGA